MLNMLEHSKWQAAALLKVVTAAYDVLAYNMHIVPASRSHDHRCKLLTQ